MRKAIFALPALMLMLSACDMVGGGADTKITETKMDDLDSIEGTISDEMMPIDELDEQPVIDKSGDTNGKAGSTGKTGSAPAPTPDKSSN